MLRQSCTILLLWLLVACTSAPIVEPSLSTGPWQVQEQWACGNADLLPFIDNWATETETRYPEFFLIVAHGQTLDGEWHVFPDEGDPVPTSDAVAVFRERGVDERIVLVVCNPQGHSLNSPGVSYARKTVWSQPDRFLTFRIAAVFRDHPEDGIGSIDEFVHNP